MDLDRELLQRKGLLPGPISHVLQFFAYDHLPTDLQTVSAQFHELAYFLVDVLPANPELTVSLRKLLESKDAAVRAKVAS